MKSIKFSEHGAQLTVHDGPAAGEYPVSAYDLEFRVKDGILSLGHKVAGGRTVNLQIRLADVKGIEGLQAFRAKEAKRLEAIPLDCDRCGKAFPRTEATFRPARVGAIKCKLPYCRECARYLFEVEDGFGETSPSYPPADATPYHKELDY